MSPLDIEVVSATRIFPKSPPTQSRTVPLSIVDASVASFAVSAAIWMYDLPTDASNLPAIDSEHLLVSLQRTLDSYPQWAGQLQPVEYHPSGIHTERFRRVCIQYGASTDPGVEFVVARSPHALADFTPDMTQRQAGNGCWDASHSFTELLPTKPPRALHDMVEFAGLPCLLVQITTFVRGGVSIGVKMAHALADAHSLTYFVRDWAAVNRALLLGVALPKLSPTFDPALLDAAAAGDIDAPTPSPTLMAITKPLPQHRYDWWASAEGCPPPLLRETVIPPNLNPTLAQPLGPALPWAEWDMSIPCSHYIIHFSNQEVRRIWQDASSTATARISRLDALLAHIWTLLIRARQLDQDFDETFMDISFGLRQRLVPPLPDSFLGSPLAHAAVSTKSHTTLSEKASSLRTTLARFDAQTIPALLHSMAYHVSPQRQWNAFLGKRHTLVTSWLRLGVYDVDFGTGKGARYVDPGMPNIDGLLQVMEGGSGDGGGMSVSLHLVAEVMERLVGDSLLRKYAV